MKKLYFSDSEYNQGFFWVSRTPKTIKIEWVRHLNCDGEELDQNIRYKELKVNTNGKNRKHCLRQNDEDGILIYPFQVGLPFYLTPATLEDIEREIKDCKSWGISFKYYEDLKEFI